MVTRLFFESARVKYQFIYKSQLSIYNKYKYFKNVYKVLLLLLLIRVPESYCSGRPDHLRTIMPTLLGFKDASSPLTQQVGNCLCPASTPNVCCCANFITSPFALGTPITGWAGRGFKLLHTDSQDPPD